MNILELIVALVLVGVAALLLNPWSLWMPDMAHMALLACLLVVFALFAVFVIRERANDERDVAHRSRAGRAAFLVGSLLLVLGIIFESLQGTPDPWLVGSLMGMILTKIAVRLYADWKS